MNGRFSVIRTRVGEGKPWGSEGEIQTFRSDFEEWEQFWSQPSDSIDDTWLGCAYAAVGSRTGIPLKALNFRKHVSKKEMWGILGLTLEFKSTFRYQ
jgi:hypothetical protein